MIYEAFDILTGKGIPVSNIYSEVYFWIEAPLNLPEGRKRKEILIFAIIFRFKSKLMALNFEL
jgi:hypothetical protein